MNDSPAVILYDAAGNPVAVTLDGSVYRLETVGKLRRADGTVVNPATEDGNLASIKDTDGIKKITDPLPAGTNLLGRATITQNGNDAIVGADGSLLVRAVQPSVGAGMVNAYLETSGGSSEMAVNGSGTPVVFEWNPGSNDVDGLALALAAEDATIHFGDKFMGISALANGVLVEVKAGDVTHTLHNIKRTREIAQNAVPGSLQVYSATPDILVARTSLAGLNFKKSGTYVTDDYVRVTIRDNLSLLDHMSILFSGLEVV